MAGWPYAGVDFDAPEHFDRVEYVIQTTNSSNPLSFILSFDQGNNDEYDLFEGAMQDLYDRVVAWMAINSPMNGTVQVGRSFYAGGGAYGFKAQGDAWPSV